MFFLKKKRSIESLLIHTIKYVISTQKAERLLLTESETEILIYLTWYLKAIRYINHILQYHCMSLTSFQGKIPTDT